MSIFLKKFSLVAICVVCATQLESCAIQRVNHEENEVFCPLGDEVYLDNGVFLQGNVLGEIPIEMHWSKIKLGRGYCRLDGAVFVTCPREQVSVRHTAFYLIKYDCEKKMNYIKEDGEDVQYKIRQYGIIEKIGVRDKEGQFRIRVSRKKLEKYYLAVRVPGGRTIVYKLCQ